LTLAVSVVSPEEELFSAEAEFVRAKTVEGEIGILSGHVPLLAQLAPCQLKIRHSNQETLLEVSGGFMSVKDNKVIILAEITGQTIE
jgi:F-type H+-transporting ATPase subunit epsilon